MCCIFNIIGACSKRYVMAIMGFIGIANAYAMRSVLSVAITEMVEDIHKTAIDPNGCPGPTKSANTTNLVCNFYRFCYYVLSFFHYKQFNQTSLKIRNI